LELGLAISAVEESKLLPESLLRRPDLNTGVAFDSFDLFVETLTGKDTLYDTVGIVTQDIPPDGDNIIPLAESEDKECDIILQTGKRRRAFILRDIMIEPFYKKTRMLSEPMPALIGAKLYPTRYHMFINHSFHTAHTSSLPKCTPLPMGVISLKKRSRKIRVTI
jgi:hypothetical protein